MGGEITVFVNGLKVSVAAGSMASTAVAAAGVCSYRASVAGEPRGPLCGMGVCFECRATIDGHPHRRSCQTACRPGMEIETHGP